MRCRIEATVMYTFPPRRFKAICRMDGVMVNQGIERKLYIDAQADGARFKAFQKSHDYEAAGAHHPDDVANGNAASDTKERGEKKCGCATCTLTQEALAREVARVGAEC